MDKNIPEWYWKRGLHDARIVSVTKKESSWNPIDAVLEDGTVVVLLNNEWIEFKAN